VILSRVLRSTLLATTIAAVSVAGCTETPTAPSNFAPFTVTDLRVGTGGDAVNGKLLTVNYTGWLYNTSRTDNKGAIFDTTAGADPFTFQLGAQGVIQGWDQGLAGMRVGGLRRLVIPPSLAYGAARNGVIPPNATLLFEVELVEVE
jgi:FKBP-type peptidyl-prolyl cis-trans isomerase FkpA